VEHAIMTIKDRLLSSLPFIEQAYDDKASAESFCAERNLTLLGMIEADPAVTTQIKARESGLLAFLGLVLPPDNNPWGDFIYNPVTKTLDVCERGTGTGLEWIADLLAILVLCRYFPGRCHKGMQLVFDCIFQSVRALIAQVPKDVALIRVHGHSLGTELAAMTAAQLRQIIIGIPIEVYLWEPPRFLDPATAASWNRAFPDAWAIKNCHDLVVTLPARWNGFGDIGQDVWVEGGWDWKNLKIAHHLETGPGPGVEKIP
jgi:hypothetical protein